MQLDDDFILLFRQVADLSREERERHYIAKGIDASMRREVESLLIFDQGKTISLEDIVQRAVKDSFHENVGEGESCGPYQLLRQIGRGGMGVVYLAQRIDGEVRQQVAVKLLRFGADMRGDTQRFLQERQILANLTHANIARLIDAGHRDDSQPYLVMEYIEGQPIDLHCQTLSLRAKIALMIPVCEAVGYAHQKLVIHRDLKPGNILVESNGNPKLLDFGIAKLIDTTTDTTATLDRRLTPDYASPEQLSGLTVGTTSDIFSLGCVLYKILTGTEPFTAKGSSSGSGPMARTVPARPSKLATGIDKDLDAIVMKAMRDEPNARYPTADRLADDLRAWLDRRPVTARQGERWYRGSRYLRRYWVPVAAAIVAFAGLTIGLVVAQRERDVAKRRFSEVRQLANQLFVVENDIHLLPGATAARERIVNTSLGYLERLSKEAGNDWELKLELASHYRKVAEIQGVFASVNLGRVTEATASLQKAEALLREVWAVKPKDRQLLRSFIETTHLQSRVDFGAKRIETLSARTSMLRKLLADYEALSPGGASEWAFLGATNDWLTTAFRELNQFDEAGKFARRAIDLRRSLVQSADAANLAQARSSFSSSLVTYSRLARASGALEEAHHALQEALSFVEQASSSDPSNYKAKLNLANTLMSLGRILGDESAPSLGRTNEAVQHFEKSLRLGREVMASDPKETLIRYNHSISAWRMGDALRSVDPARAVAAYDEAITTSRSIETRSFTRDIPLAIVLAESTFPLRRLHREREARQRLEEASSIAELYRSREAQAAILTAEAVSRAEAAWALESGNPSKAAELHRGWLKRSETGKPSVADDARIDYITAFLLCRRYRMMADAANAAGLTDEARLNEIRRADLVKWWAGKLPGRNVEIVLSR